MATAAISGATLSAPLASALHTKLGAKAQAATANGTSSGTGTDSNSLSAGNLGTTFLNLLVQELQNQDPTQPMDPTAMVGQMISLNQLDQLISINQSITGTTTGSGSGADATSAAGKTAAAAAAAAGLGADGKEKLSGSAAPSSFAPSDPLQAANAALVSGVGSLPTASAVSPTAPLDLSSFSNLNALRGGK